MDLSLSFGVIVEFKNNTEWIGQGLCPYCYPTPPQLKVSQHVNFILKHLDQFWGCKFRGKMH